MIKDGDINDFGGGDSGSESETYQTFKKYLLTFLVEVDEGNPHSVSSFMIDGKWYETKYGEETFQILLNDLEEAINKLKNP